MRLPTTIIRLYWDSFEVKYLVAHAKHTHTHRESLKEYYRPHYRCVCLYVYVFDQFT